MKTDHPEESPYQTPNVQPAEPPPRPGRVGLLQSIVVGIAAFTAAWLVMVLVLFAFYALKILPLTAPLVLRYCSLVAAVVIGVVVAVRYRARLKTQLTPENGGPLYNPIVAGLFLYGCCVIWEVAYEILHIVRVNL